MKKNLSFLLIICIVCSCLLSLGAADTMTPGAPAAAGITTVGTTAQDSSAAAGVDVVVVLDMSNSMTTRDPNNYRLDATAMMIGMLDNNGSRVAVVPFHKELLRNDTLTELTEVGKSNNRQKLIREIYSYKDPNKLGGGTNYGSALMKAIEILMKRGTTENQPMIVLMTDGYTDFTSVKNIKIEDQYWDDGKIQTNGAKSYDDRAEEAKEAADRITEQAVEAAHDNGIPIYTLILGEKRDAGSGGAMTMLEISRQTGLDETGSIGLTNTNEANLLPGFFASVLADKIGSSVNFEAEPKKIDEKGNELDPDSKEAKNSDLYRIELPLVNSSIKEANIILPVKTRNADPRITVDNVLESLKVMKGGKEKDYKIWPEKENINHFIIIKIMDVEGGEDWTLQYKTAEEPSAGISLLYNYDIKLSASITDRQANPNGAIYKNDVLTLDAEFVDLNGNQIIPPDEQLYVKHDGKWTVNGVEKGWGTINAFYTIEDENKQPITDPAWISLEPGKNTNGKYNRFTGEIQLADYREAGKLPEGTYTVKVAAEGAGLKRDVELSFDVLNRAPEPTAKVTNGIYQHPEIKVNKTTEDPNSGESWGVISRKLGEEMTEEPEAVLAEALISDPDHESLKYSLTQTSGEDVLKLELVKDGNGKDVIQFTTVQEEGERKNKSGEATAVLKAEDDNGGTCEAQVSVGVISLYEHFWDAYDIKVLVGDSDNAADAKDADTYTFRKRQDLTIWVYLVDAAGEDAEREELDSVNPAVSILKTRSQGSETDPVDVQRIEDDENYPRRNRYRAQTGGNETTWTVMVTCGQETQTKTITIPNQHAPVVLDNVPTDDLQLNCGGDWTLSFLGNLIGENTPAEDLILSTDQIFRDDDGDSLNVSGPKFCQPGTTEELPADMISARQVGRHYEIEFSGDSTGIWRSGYECDMVITAEDEDGKTQTYTRHIRVRHLHNRFWGLVLNGLLVLAVLVIIFLIIHQIRKPKFPMLNLTIREEPSLFTSGSETLSPVKTPTNVNAMGVDGDMAARHNISMDLLQNIAVKPIRSDISVGVICKKVIGGHEVTLEDVKLKPKKQYTWKLEQELIIRNMNGEGMIAIKLEDRRGESGDDGDTDIFGGAGDWTDNDLSSENATYSAGKRSKKVKKSAAPAEEENSFSGGDDFDF